MTLYELNIMTEALRLRLVDEARNRADLAYQTFRATAKDRKGRAVYTTFRKFFDYEKELKKASGATAPDEEKIRAIGRLLYGGD